MGFGAFLDKGGSGKLTQIYFASSPRADLLSVTFGLWDWMNKPLNILVAFPFLDTWKKEYRGWPCKATMLDSGAFSAWSVGEEIDFDALCEEAKNPHWTEVVALDVIGDGRASFENALKMKARGLTVMPVFHFGDDWGMLQEYKDQFGDRIGLGGIATGISSVQRIKWLDQVFARAYPARFHLFGCVKRDILLRFPAVTADSSSWASGTRFGVSKQLKGLRIPKKSEVGESNADLRFEILAYLDLEAECIERWKSELAWAREPEPLPL